MAAHRQGVKCAGVVVVGLGVRRGVGVRCAAGSACARGKGKRASGAAKRGHSRALARATRAAVAVAAVAWSASPPRRLLSPTHRRSLTAHVGVGGEHPEPVRVRRPGAPAAHGGHSDGQRRPRTPQPANHKRTHDPPQRLDEAVPTAVGGVRCALAALVALALPLAPAVCTITSRHAAEGLGAVARLFGPCSWGATAPAHTRGSDA